MPVTAVELTLQRPAPGPWGLRLQGGLDYDKTLVISHVTEGTHSSLSGLMVQYGALMWQYCQECDHFSQAMSYSRSMAKTLG